MSRTHGKQTVPIRGIFVQKASQRDAPTRRGARHCNMRNWNCFPLQKFSVSKVSNAPKRLVSTHVRRRKSKVAGSPMAVSNSPGSGGERILHTFVDSINTTQYQIQEEISNSLANAEKTLAKQLTQTVTKHNKSVELSRVMRAVIFSPLEPESLDRIASPSDNKDTVHLVNVRSLLNPAEKALKRHWKVWNKTQQKIACLAVEMLGAESVTLPHVTKEAIGSMTFKKRLSRATSAFGKQHAVELTTLADERKWNDNISYLAREMKRQVTAQEKKSRGDKRKQREEICQLARKLIANL
ncbi:hypothetical protein I7I48_06872 [Histoplasma ohiense]|nr:hypothetical protein I7I48_06872 [Histoplasma ohiense (nom. inval.)]